jgi:hypothetical protein
MTPLGAFLGGVLGTTLGLRPTIAIGAIGASLSVVLLLLWPLRRGRAIADADALLQPYNERFQQEPSPA